MLCLLGVLNFNFEFTAFTTNMRPQRVFSLVQTCVLVDVNQLLPWFSRVDLEKILSSFLEHSEEYVSVSASFRNILLQDLTPLYVKTTRSIKLLSFYRRKLKVLTYLHTVSY